MCRVKYWSLRILSTSHPDWHPAGEVPSLLLFPLHDLKRRGHFNFSASEKGLEHLIQGSKLSFSDWEEEEKKEEVQGENEVVKLNRSALHTHTKEKNRRVCRKFFFLHRLISRGGEERKESFPCTKRTFVQSLYNVKLIFTRFTLSPCFLVAPPELSRRIFAPVYVVQWRGRHTKYFLTASPTLPTLLVEFQTGTRLGTDDCLEVRHPHSLNYNCTSM